MELIKYSLLCLLILGWTLNPFMKRRAIGKLSSMEYFVVNFLLTSVLCLIIWMILIRLGKCQVYVFNKMTTIELIWAIGAAILTVLTGVALICLVKIFEVGHIIPQIQPGVILLTVFIGYIIFGESMDIFKCMGVILIVIGMILINTSKKV